ncbi:MAG: hypothetical protein IKJ52_05820 [Muribaculaceae bacterium]|nr:hypothetical protein [Muribaculaceae bacterium]
MLRSDSNITISVDDAKQFRSRMRNCIEGRFSQKERSNIQSRKERMARVTADIVKNNGGKNPILGY